MFIDLYIEKFPIFIIDGNSKHTYSIQKKRRLQITFQFAINERRFIFKRKIIIISRSHFLIDSSIYLSKFIEKLGKKIIIKFARKKMDHLNNGNFVCLDAR